MYPGYNHHDGPLAAGYLMLAARFLGYGTVYATDSINPELTKKMLAIPDRYQIVCSTPLGIPDRWPESPHKKDLSEFLVFGFSNTTTHPSKDSSVFTNTPST